MNKFLRHGNYLSLLLVLVGATLWLSYSLATFKGRAGLALLLLGVAGLAAYFFSHRSRFRGKNSRLNFIFASNLAVVVLLIVAIVAAVNYLGVKVHQRFDFTAGRAHSLSDQSVRVARGLKKDLNIKAFFSKSHGNLGRFESLMEIYRFHSGKIKVTVIDPYLRPELVKQYEIKADGTLVFEYEGKSTRSEEVSEESITNAIINVSRQGEKTVYFTQGHGEPDIDSGDETGYSEARTGLEKLSFKVKKLVLFQEAAVPGDAAAVIVAGPQKSLFEKETILLQNYLEKEQGRLLLLLNPYEGNELKPLLKRYGLLLEDNVVVEIDPLSQFMGGNYFMPVVAKYPAHPITRNFGYATMFPLARGLGRVSPLPEGVTVDFLASTSPNSWGETQYESEVKTEKITRNENDKPGPLDIAAACESPAGSEKKSRLVVVGDSDFAQNKYYYFQANGNFFNNAVSWLAEEKDLIAIAPKVSVPRTVSLTRSAGRLVFFYTLIILPLLVFVAGIGIWLYRRKL
ncbi:MAG: GldG family protein [Candidatus Aminicenantes bacterium]|nr:GldG family protein [Candidatus Aminicenantes bacterium]